MSDSEKRMNTATDLLNHGYCARIIYYHHVLKKPQFTTKKEYKGREKENIFQHQAKRTKVVKSYPKLPKIFKVHLASEKLGMRTIVDSVMIDEQNKEAYPIQAKFSFTPRKIYRTQRLQLAMEAMLIEDTMGYKVPFGFIKFLRSGDLVKVWITENDKQNVIESFSEINKIIYSETIPKPTKYKRRCIDCCFKRFCWG